MSSYQFEPQNKEMRQHFTSGILNAGISQTVRVFCQFASVIILSRLLTPSDFGVIAMAGPIYGFVMLFQDLGLSAATIQKPNLTHDEMNAFFWINVTIGISLTIIIIAISPLVGWYYHDNRVVPLTAAMGLLVTINTLGNQHGALLQRRMEFRTSALLDALATLSGFIVSVSLAFYFKNYWSLYIGMLAGTIVPIIGVWLIVKWKPSNPKSVPGLMHMLKFGVGITSFNVSNFLSRNVDNILIGRYWGDIELGLYDRAYKLLLFPLQRVVVPVSTIMVPLLSRLVGEPERYKMAFLKTLAQLTFITWPGILWAIILADTLIPTILGENWAKSIPIFVPLAFASLLQILNGSSGWLFITQGRSKNYARWGLVNVVTSIGAFLIGLPYGAKGVAIAYALSEIIRTVLVWPYVTKSGAVKLIDIIEIIFPQFVALVTNAVVLVLIRENSHLPVYVNLPLCLITSYAVVTLTMLIFSKGRQTVQYSIEFIKLTFIHTFSKLVS